MFLSQWNGLWFSMEAAQRRIAKHWRDIAASVFLWSLTGLSFFAYPLAVFPPVVRVGQSVGFNLVHTISIPGVVLLGFLAVPVMSFFSWRLPRFLVWALIVYSIMLLVNDIIHG